MVIAAAFLLAACVRPARTTAPVFVVDDNGIVRRVNPDEKNVYLVFTAHYSENDSGYFENLDGIVPVCILLSAVHFVESVAEEKS